MKSQWYKVPHREDYRIKIETIENVIFTNNRILKYQCNCGCGIIIEIELFTERHSCFPSLYAANLFAKMRIRNEIRRLKRRIEALRGKLKKEKENG